MISDKAATLRSLIESKEGLHLTGYIRNEGGPAKLKERLGSIIADAEEFLPPELPSEERKNFLAPLEELRRNIRILDLMKGDIGLFRTREAFRALSLPVEVETQCIVATTFHVKPLLRWMQVDRSFLLLGFEKDAASIYVGNLESLVAVDSIVLEDNDDARLKLTPVHGWLAEMTARTAPKLFLAGPPELTSAFQKFSPYPRLGNAISDSFSTEESGAIAREIRSALRKEVSSALQQAIREFHEAEDLRLSKKNIFQIAKAAVQGRIRKLIIADETRIFGKIDRNTGGLAIHPCDLDHEDDDLLDDLAQTVLANGGEVIVASQNELPKGRPLLAILKHEDDDETAVRSFPKGKHYSISYAKPS